MNLFKHNVVSPFTLRSNLATSRGNYNYLVINWAGFGAYIGVDKYYGILLPFWQ